MKIEIEGKITEKEHAAAQWLHIKPRPVFAFVGIVLIIVALSVLWLSFFGPYYQPNGFVRWAVLALLIYMFLYWVIIQPLKWKRIYRQQKSLNRPFSLEVTEQGISAKSENMEGNTPWAGYQRWREGNGVFLLYWSDVLFQIIPFRFFQNGEQMKEFKNILRQKVSG